MRLWSRHQVRRAAAAEAGRLFLNASAAVEGAIQTESGLVYLETQAGKGKSPAVSDTVSLHYKGSLADGTVFGSSGGGKPYRARGLRCLIKGWMEGLQLMKEGGKCTLTIPPDIAYGECGQPYLIPPGAHVVFEIELVEVERATSATPAMAMAGVVGS